MELGGPRWKGKGFEDIAQANPMSEIISRLQTSLTQSEASATLSGCTALLESEPEAAELLERASFGQKITNCNDDKHWFQLAPEESFYLCHALKCIKILRKDNTLMDESELWNHFGSKRKTFPEVYKAYSHLRLKNWVVRSGTHYGADFVAYRHHPALVHAEYAVLVIPEKDGNVNNARLSQWSDLCCSLRLSGSVAKTLLVLHVSSCDRRDWSSLSCLEQVTVEEQIIRRWIPERSREDKHVEVDEAH
ncbi:putative tRNA-splicing endonuclease subunit Sen2 [Canna indica]|uniref:tRNA-intron lyase n=1 Tax=Canna indica TaxID=4628 RepID=A0AAQ3Q8L5_9LILI|nr:putative tRNA-splicing endonuclease subunit Sen2 [Canna indica]